MNSGIGDFAGCYLLFLRGATLRFYRFFGILFGEELNI